MGRGPGEATASLWVSDASIGKAARTPRGCRRGSKCQPGPCPATRIAASFAVPDDSRDRHAPAADLRRVAPRPHPAGTSGRGAGRTADHRGRALGLRPDRTPSRSGRALRDRKSDVWGKSVSVRIDLDGRRTIKKKRTIKTKK